MEAGYGHCRVVMTSRYLYRDNTTARQHDNTTKAKAKSRQHNKYRAKLRHEDMETYKDFHLL